jgi:hypothetical protein
VQAFSAADDLSTWGKRLPVRKHDPVFTGRLGTISTELGQSKPVIIGPVAAKKRDTGAFDR